MPESEDAKFGMLYRVGDYTRKCISKVVIGLGGVDSSLVAAIATAALGQEMLGVLMPYSSEHSIQTLWN